MPRLLDLDGQGELTAAHVRLVAQALGKSERTVWRWLAAAREDHRLARVESSHFTVTAEVRRLLALWGGNASRVHAELMQRAAEDADAPVVPSLSTLHRAIRRDLTRGERSGLRRGGRIVVADVDAETARFRGQLGASPADLTGGRRRRATGTRRTLTA
ncbi:hypothetical protein PV417_30660 [Streptomyces sp. ME19-03-3]|nr:hypothetical protein [Streptomyces sp. ME19-03-3]